MNLYSILFPSITSMTSLLKSNLLKTTILHLSKIGLERLDHKTSLPTLSFVAQNDTKTLLTRLLVSLEVQMLFLNLSVNYSLIKLTFCATITKLFMVKYQFRENLLCLPYHSIILGFISFEILCDFWNV
jgi:hypothetical protein